jgi:exopolyphosphatase/guanosine-5'-triphosphate,3'-diphosphate pyrophosphatase
MRDMNNGSDRVMPDRAPIAAFDIGTNSIKLSVGEIDDKGNLRELLALSQTVRLGQGIEATGHLADDRIDAALTVLTDFADRARSAGARRLIGVATEATRVAENGPAFLATIRDRIGIDIQAISGDREAELTFRGLAASISLDGTVAVADIGGGSTEIILARNREFSFGTSIPLGSSRLTDRFVHADPPDPDELRECERFASEALQRAASIDPPVDRLVAIGGTGEYLERLVPTGHAISIDRIEQILDELTRMTAGDLAGRIGIAEARARVLPAGIAVVQAFARAVQPGRIEVARSGIRTGLLLAAFAGEI